MSTYDPTSTEGLAEHASERLRMNARGLFTSDLSVNEYLCVEKAGFEPVGLVVGSSIYHIGYQQSSWKASQEMGVLTQAMYSARELAMTRMEEEADQLGADGIVGSAWTSAATSGARTWLSSSRSAPRSDTRVGRCTVRPTGAHLHPISSGQAFWT